MTKRIYPIRHCSECGVEINYRAKSGLCRLHFVARLNTDPEMIARRVEGNRRMAITPEGREMRRQIARAYMNAKWACPKYRAHMTEHLRTVIQPLACTPEALANRDNVARGRKLSETRLAWCPPEYRADYRKLLRSGIKKVEAVQIIRDHIKVQRARLSPFERQEQDLAAKLARGEEAVASNDMFRRRAA